jgi:hypothetical protein
VQVAVKVAIQKSSVHSASVLGLLERLRELKRATLDQALQHATDVLAAAFAADKVDACLCNRELTEELARRLKSTSVTANAVHPGSSELLEIVLSIRVLRDQQVAGTAHRAGQRCASSGLSAVIHSAWPRSGQVHAR